MSHVGIIHQSKNLTVIQEKVSEPGVWLCPDFCPPVKGRAGLCPWVGGVQGQYQPCISCFNSHPPGTLSLGFGLSSGISLWLRCKAEQNTRIRGMDTTHVQWQLWLWCHASYLRSHGSPHPRTGCKLCPSPTILSFAMIVLIHLKLSPPSILSSRVSGSQWNPQHQEEGMKIGKKKVMNGREESGQ